VGGALLLLGTAGAAAARLEGPAVIVTAGSYLLAVIIVSVIAIAVIGAAALIAITPSAVRSYRRARANAAAARAARPVDELERLWNLPAHHR
jgi:nitrate/nitrite transporter NarK